MLIASYSRCTLIKPAHCADAMHTREKEARDLTCRKVLKMLKNSNRRESVFGKNQNGQVQKVDRKAGKKAGRSAGN